MATSASTGITIANQINSTPDSPEIHAIKSRIDDLSKSATNWNVGYLFVTAIAVFIAAISFYSQFRALQKTRELSSAQSTLDSAKDRERAAADLEVALNLKAKDVEIGKTKVVAGKAEQAAAEAYERAAKAEAHLAEANARTKDAEKAAAEASAKAEGFRLDIATANQRAGEANKDASVARREAEQLRRENLLLQADVLKLRARTEFRHLNQVQQEGVLNKIKPFAPVQFALIIYNTGDDSGAIAGDILSIVSSAGWVRESQITTSASSAEPGILIELNSNATKESADAATALADALRDEGLYVPPVRPYQRDAAIINAGPGSAWQVSISIKRRP